jgi:hypothetical protein
MTTLGGVGDSRTLKIDGERVLTTDKWSCAELIRLNGSRTE